MLRNVSLELKTVFTSNPKKTHHLKISEKIFEKSLDGET